MHIEELDALAVQEYHSPYPSPACQQALLEFVEETPHAHHLPVIVTKHLVKVGTRLRSPQASMQHLDRLHGYAHHAIKGLSQQRGKGPQILRGHFYRDGADIAAQQHDETGDVTYAHEAMQDYGQSASLVGLADPRYMLSVLCDRALFALRTSHRLHDDQFLVEAHRTLAAFPCGLRDVSKNGYRQRKNLLYCLDRQTDDRPQAI